MVNGTIRFRVATACSLVCVTIVALMYRAKDGSRADARG